MNVEHMNKYALALALLVALTLFNCTGTNIRNIGMISGTGTFNTNPVPFYGEPSYAFLGRAGALYHHEATPGPTPGLAKGVKRGESCSHSLAGLWAWGDSSIDTARKQGKIEKIGYIEYEHIAVLAVLYHGFCTTVAGE
ncbi:adhesin Lsa14 [Leptospira ilyithenensis]|uniref:TRL-like family protein n=1 Tax=Leptospira ilyithenensis TaxID=2484901 RepID=A0A4R9LLF7_9LEPT|nr:TRL-like family protein [Leptospira ilyithenensis]TGN06984.1 TRL-like family protein [Leptospira ilyithenensis]